MAAAGLRPWGTTTTLLCENLLNLRIKLSIDPQITQMDADCREGWSRPAPPLQKGQLQGQISCGASKQQSQATGPARPVARRRVSMPETASAMM
jgi:hypothetical protein